MMPARRAFLILPAALLLAAGCAVQPAAVPEAGPPVTDEATLAALDQILAGDHRSAAHRARDAWRHPRETLAFLGLRQDMAVMEVWPGGSGWYTEILAPLLRDRGLYVAASWDPKSESRFIQDNLKAYADKLAARPDLYGRVRVAALQHPNELAPVAPGTMDMVLTFRNVHNWMARDSAEAMFAAMYAALKPGGILGVVEHRAADDVEQDPKARSGYVREDYTIAMAERAGFELIGKSDINANPQDTKNHPHGVWSLPPTLRGGDEDRARFEAIGESDRFTLRFRRPRPAG